MGEEVTRECTNDADIFSIAQILAESLINPIFLNGLKWVGFSRFDSDQCESSRYFQSII